MRLLLKAGPVDHDTCVHCQHLMTKGGELSPEKAKEILRDGTVHGHPITKKQRGYFGAVAGGNSTLTKASYRFAKPGKGCPHCHTDSDGDDCDYCGFAKSATHPGFEAVAQGIAARQGISPERARAVLAVGAQRASAAAKKANPHLKRVAGMHKATTFVKGGGEGSRGGRVIGHTKSGKPIYAEGTPHSRYEVAPARRWEGPNGRTASARGAVPWAPGASAEERGRWTMRDVGFTVHDKTTGTSGVGRQPWKTREEAEHFVNVQRRRDQHPTFGAEEHAEAAELHERRAKDQPTEATRSLAAAREHRTLAESMRPRASVPPSSGNAFRKSHVLGPLSACPHCR